MEGSQQYGKGLGSQEEEEEVEGSQQDGKGLGS